MTAGSYMYIGPQGIVHGTTITVLNAGRRIDKNAKDLTGKIYVTSGLGGMSGAQPKATVIAKGVCLIAEINPKVCKLRMDQGWVNLLFTDCNEAIDRALLAKKNGEALSIAYQGNIVTLWEELAKRNVKIELGSDQTSLHNPWSGGYYPVELSFDESQKMIREKPDEFKKLVQCSLKRQVSAIKKLTDNGMYFWDYGNAFLLEASRAGAPICNSNGTFIYPSYIQDIMGPLFFDYGFGPFRWVVTSNLPADLQKSDEIAARVLEEIYQNAPDEIVSQLADNIHWIKEAQKNNLVVGTQARILYADCEGRIKIAKAFNAAIKCGEITAPIVLGRDHHDVSGTDSPYRETSNIYDGSSFCADMAIHNVIGDAMRGASWVSIHNGGGVGFGESINGGFGLVIDGSEMAEERLTSMLFWDVNNGVARRAWAQNREAKWAINRESQRNQKEGSRLTVTKPIETTDEILTKLLGV